MNRSTQLASSHPLKERPFLLSFFNASPFVHLTAAVSALWYPLIHLIRFWLTPEGFIYTGVESTDIALFVWTMNAPYLDFSALRDLESTVSIFLRADHMAIILLPYAFITTLFGLSGVVGYTLVLCFWNAMSVYATYHFYLVFLNQERISTLATILSYSLSGVSGLLVILNWAIGGALSGDFSSALPLSGWIGENHKLSNEFYDGNAITTLTNMSRAHYLIPRAFGLLSLALLHESIKQAPTKPLSFALILSGVFMMLCTLFHPASGLVYAMMFAVLFGFYFFQESPVVKSAARRHILYPFSGFLLATIYWQYYRTIPEAKKLIDTYLQILHNTDPLPLLFATIPTLGVALYFIFKRLNTGRILLALTAAVLWLVGLSEFVISSQSVGIRAGLLSAMLFCSLLFVFIARAQILSALRNPRWQYGGLMLAWAVLALIVSASPHHDFRTVLYSIQSESGFIAALRKLSDVGNMLFAARFKLGIWIPLIGAFTFFVYQQSVKVRKAILVVVFVITLPSSLIYLSHTCSQGYILEEEFAAYSFLKAQSGENVMCASESGIFLPNIALKRSFGTFASDANWKTHRHDMQAFYQTDSDSLRHLLIEKYRIDFIVVGRHERALGATPSRFEHYAKRFEQGATAIYKTDRTPLH
jgi:hypothetical protein